jgi:hypothetical protein
MPGTPSPTLAGCGTSEAAHASQRRAPLPDHPRPGLNRTYGSVEPKRLTYTRQYLTTRTGPARRKVSARLRSARWLATYTSLIVGVGERPVDDPGVGVVPLAREAASTQAGDA